ncbi:MAG: hypothetical protein IKI32_03950 [Lachnospiraceae bacterium]|nr:hypothetical protein [Lachnospiraceae bacterium]MBR4141970.1 hypothetical protein [Bacillota bacterium]MBR7076058.1 hypothetical protein [Lachnospiraceae bacterium]
MRYEVIREIFNKCSGNQMRDVFVSTVETDDPEGYVRNLLKGKEVVIDKDVLPDGTIEFDVDIAGLKQRFSFTED